MLEGDAPIGLGAGLEADGDGGRDEVRAVERLRAVVVGGEGHLDAVLAGDALADAGVALGHLEVEVHEVHLGAVEPMVDDGVVKHREAKGVAARPDNDDFRSVHE